MQKKFLGLVKFLIFKTLLIFTLFENLELHEIKAGSGSSEVHWGRSFRDILKAKAAQHFVLEKNSQILSENYSVEIQMSNSGSDNRTYESSSESGLEGVRRVGYRRQEENKTWPNYSLRRCWRGSVPIWAHSDFRMGDRVQWELKKAAEHECELKKRLVGVLQVSDWHVISPERRIFRHFITSFA